MDLTPFGYTRRRDTVVVLGAGASRGASFATAGSVLRPPLDTDFFTQLKASAVGQEHDGERLLEFLDAEFGDSDVSMEAFYSQVHLHDQFVADLPRGKGRRRSYEWAMTYFLRAIPLLFGDCIGTSRCRWHDALVGALDARDVIVSFNYDCIVDTALRDVGKRKWDPSTGYGVTAGGQLDAWKSHAGTGRFPKQGHRLLKPHGSLNWRMSRSGLELIADPYAARQDGQLCIVPPLWQKSFDSSPFHDVWLRCRSAFTATKALVVIGYSLPQTDVYTQAMLRIDVQALDFLLLANPDPIARTRIKRVLRSALRPSTRIVEVDSLEILGHLLQPRGAFERMQARLTYEPVNFRTGDVAAVVAAGRGDDLVHVATGPTAHASKQRQLIRELLLLGEVDRAAQVAGAIANRSEAINTLLTAIDLTNRGEIKKRDVQALVDAIWGHLKDDQQDRLMTPLLGAGVTLPLASPTTS